MKLDFTKMSGAGNDFVVIDNRSGTIKEPSQLAKKLCDRRWGIGADGLLLLERSMNASYHMAYYNSDGSHGGMCGNGGRCMAQYAFLHSIAGREQQFDALGFIYSAKVVNGLVSLSMKSPEDLKLNLMLRLGRRRIRAHYVNTGSPHVVIPTKKIETVNVAMLGRKIRHDRQFSPEGTNVNFVERLDAKQLKIRTYERGVEDETLACGTGSVASAIIASRIWRISSPINIVPKSGVELQVHFSRNRKGYGDVKLSGPATVLFTGSIDV
ncbi:MAG: diaminopimelate epimerase [Ignavibacteriales bacterium]|nr:diaminopimelate epimerase [Ignavibacteriales bacterium]